MFISTFIFILELMKECQQCFYKTVKLCFVAEVYEREGGKWACLAREEGIGIN